MSDGQVNLGRTARLAGGPAPELVAAGHQAEIAHGQALAEALSLSDLAHAVVLLDAGAVRGETGRDLVAGLLELHDIPADEFPWDASRGDAFNSREHVLRERVGPAASGWLTAGRPRREAFRVALRIVARRGVLDLADRLLDLADALTDQGERHAATLAADYTYLQPAQPTTFGHLMLGFAEAVRRDVERLRRVHDWLDHSVAGCGGSSGSRWPLDRARLAEYLGCEAVAIHTKDAMWAADGYADLASVVAIALTGQSQLAQDLEILCSREFGAVELADAHSRQSDLMPQKKNPYALPVIRAAAAEAAGMVTTILTALHTGSARTDNYQVLNGGIPTLLGNAVRTTALSAAVVSDLTVNQNAMAAAAREGFTVAADVADVVAQVADIDYRTAHTIVGRSVRRLSDEGLPPSALTGELLRTIGMEIAGGRVHIPDEAVEAALDPAACLAARTQIGSATPDQIDAMVADGRDRGLADRAWITGNRRRADLATERLLGRARELAG